LGAAVGGAAVGAGVGAGAHAATTARIAINATTSKTYLFIFFSSLKFGQGFGVRPVSDFRSLASPPSMTLGVLRDSDV
jgi:hypothetical protein